MLKIAINIETTMVPMTIPMSRISAGSKNAMRFFTCSGPRRHRPPRPGSASRQVFPTPLRLQSGASQAAGKLRSVSSAAKSFALLDAITDRLDCCGDALVPNDLPHDVHRLQERYSAVKQCPERARETGYLDLSHTEPTIGTRSSHRSNFIRPSLLSRKRFRYTAERTSAVRINHSNAW